jgi:multidrug resistance efflux pump
MKVSQKSRNQDSEIRVTAPAVVTINECQFLVQDWSLEGFGISEFNQKIQIGDCLPIQFCLSFKGGTSFSTFTLIEVVERSILSSKVEARFLNLTNFEKESLKAIIANLQKGELEINVEEFSSASLGKNVSIKQAPKRKDHKFFLTSLGYLAIGGVVISSTVLYLYKSLIQLEINSAILSKPIEPVISTNQGIINQVYVHEGMTVKAGQPLFRVNDEEIARSIAQHEVSNVEALKRDKIQNLNALTRNKIENIDGLTQKIEVTTLELTEAKVALRNAEALREQEIENLNSSKAIAQSKLASARAKVNSLNVQYQSGKNTLDRFSALLQAGAVSQQVVDSASSKFAEVDGTLKAAKAELEIAQTALNSVQKGSFYDSQRFVGDLLRLTTDVNNAHQRVQLATKKITVFAQERDKHKQEMKDLEKQKQILEKNKQVIVTPSAQEPFDVVYKAPVSGSVIKIVKSSGNKINRGETLVVLQPKIAQPTIEAYLTQDQVAQVSMGNIVTVSISELNKTYKAQVVKIDRTGGLVDEVRGQYQFHGSKDQSAYVKLIILGMTQKEKSQLMAGMPVQLKITKKLTVFDRLGFLNRGRANN